MIRRIKKHLKLEKLLFYAIIIDMIIKRLALISVIVIAVVLIL